MINPRIPRTEGGVSISTVVLPGRTEHVITVEGEAAAQAALLVDKELRLRRARPLSLFAFGGTGFPGDGDNMFPRSVIGVSQLRGDGAMDGDATAFQMAAVSGVPIAQVIQRGKSVGCVYEDEFARMCRLSAVVPGCRNASREEQTRDVLEMAEEMLGEGGFRFTDTVRTWFYLDHLLEWYDGFNAVRNEFFRTRGVFDMLVPASTGIGAGNASGSALTCDLLAIRPKCDEVSIQVVPSPLQTSALNYRSSFSRAVEILTPGCQQLLISGTASIDKEGRSAHAGDPAAQIELTVQVVDALLRSRAMGWNDVTRGIAYFKRSVDRPLLDPCFRKRGIAPFSMAAVEADICRPELDFEIEVDAVRVARIPSLC